MTALLRRKKDMKIGGLMCSVLLLALLAVGFLPSPAAATENGGGAYPNGAEGFMAGAIPPPGTYFINYMTYYTASKFKIKDGPDVPVFDLQVFANTFRFVHVTKHQVLGGNWAVQAFIPVLYLDIALPPGQDNTWGLGDIIVDPFVLSWHSKNWHFATGLDIFIPTGKYDKNDLANTGRNYWTFEPVAAFTYLSDGGFEVSGKFMYDFNTENDDTDYLSGQEFHFDYLVGYKTGPWSLGINGYYYKQTTGDEVNDEDVPGGNEGQVFAAGPAVKYDHKNMSFILKYQKEMAVENKPEGDKFWFKFVYAF